MSICATNEDYHRMFHLDGPFTQLREANPYVPSDILVKAYREKLASMSMIDPTPMNDVVGWLARRMTGQHTLDAIIMVYGDRGAGKSLACGYLGERLDIRLSCIDGKPVKSHFSIDNVRSVDKSGTLAMLSPKKLKECENQIFVIDDASIAANSRKFQTPENQYLNYILTTARIYRHCIIINTIASNLIDSVARSFADIGILVKGIIPGTSINQCYVFKMSQSNHLGVGGRGREAIGKYFQITANGEQYRMRKWYTGLPSKEFIEAYNVLRKTNTDSLGDGFDNWVVEEEGGLKKHADMQMGKREQKHHDILKKKDHVASLLNERTEKGKPLTKREICRRTGLSTSGLDTVMYAINCDRAGERAGEKKS